MQVVEPYHHFGPSLIPNNDLDSQAHMKADPRDAKSWKKLTFFFHDFPSNL
jgi:hypothetical protein